MSVWDTIQESAETHDLKITLHLGGYCSKLNPSLQSENSDHVSFLHVCYVLTFSCGEQYTANMLMKVHFSSVHGSNLAVEISVLYLKLFTDVSWFMGGEESRELNNKMTEHN